MNNVVTEALVIHITCGWYAFFRSDFCGQDCYIKQIQTSATKYLGELRRCLGSEKKCGI